MTDPEFIEGHAATLELTAADVEPDQAPAPDQDGSSDG
jgi:hypothetical protein